MKILKQIICKIQDIFNLPRFSQPPKTKISKCKIPEIVPIDEYNESIEKYFKNINFENAKIYVNCKKKRR